MDECLPLGSMDARTLRSLREKERAHRAELEQDLVQLRAILARQNDVIVELRRRDAARERQLGEMQTLVAAVTEQNTLLRQQVAGLQQENARLRGVPLAPAPDPVPDAKPAAPIREPKVRKKRAAEHNRGRQKLERATRWETDAAEHCPQCGEQLAGGWIVRRVQIIDLAPVAPLEITEHRILRRPDRREWIRAVGGGCCRRQWDWRRDGSAAVGLVPG